MSRLDEIEARLIASWLGVNSDDDYAQEAFDKVLDPATISEGGCPPDCKGDEYHFHATTPSDQ